MMGFFFTQCNQFWLFCIFLLEDVFERHLLMTEAQLISGCKQNNVLAQKELYNLYAPKMMGVCARYFANGQEAQDVLQEGMLKLFKNINNYAGKGSFEGWIRKIIINTALEQLRKNKIHFESVDQIDLDSNLSKENGFQNLKVQDLLKMIHSLPEGFRVVFNLFAIEGYSHKEIAIQLGISEGTSKSQLSRARRQLQDMIIKEKLL